MRVLTAIIAVLFISLAACARQPAPADNVPKQAKQAKQAEQKILFAEDFEDDDFAGRGWYDGPRIVTSAEVAKTGSRSCLWHWQQGERLPGGKGGRVTIEPTPSVTLSYWIRHSDNWQWTGRGYHPHEFLFMTTENLLYRGPASSHLTLYVEAIDGKPAVGMQDSQNIDTTRIDEDLTKITENRSVAGGNGDPDGHGGGFYKMGDSYRNGRNWQPEEEYFTDQPGARYQGDWHHVKARFVLNSIEDGKGVADGIIRYWQDGELIIDLQDVVFRTGAHPEMLINQFQMLPYIGPGAKADMRAWIDDIRITR
jgi:hypothetical protein